MRDEANLQIWKQCGVFLDYFPYLTDLNSPQGFGSVILFRSSIETDGRYDA